LQDIQKFKKNEVNLPLSVILYRALGQGAFGEVYQGFFRHRAGDAVEMPVAVKVCQECCVFGNQMLRKVRSELEVEDIT
jgi:hypothetical protein